MGIIFFISRPTSEVISSFRVEPIYYIETCSSRSSSIFPSTLIYGAVFPFPGGNRVLVRYNNYVHAMGPTYMSVSQSPRLDPTMISISCSNLIDLFPPSECNSAKNEALQSILPSLLQEDVEKGWCKDATLPNYDQF